jgi:prophage regulatory protein
MESKPKRFLRKPEVLNRLSIKNSTLYDWMRDGRFPKPVKLQPEGRAVAWREEDVDAFIDAAFK